MWAHPLTIFSAVLIVLAFPPWNLEFLLWICLVPWFYALTRKSTFKHSVVQGIWLSFFMSMGGFYWVAYSAQQYGGVPWTLSVLLLLIFSLFNQFQFPIFAGFLTQICWNSSVRSVFLIAFLYTAIDWCTPKLFQDTLGHGFFLSPHLRQVVEVGGVFYLTFLIVLFNWGLFQALKHRQYRTWLGIVGLVILSWTYGYFRFHQVSDKILEATQAYKGSQIAAIQGNIGDFDKVASEKGVLGAAAKVLETYTTLTTQARQLKPAPEFIIWPETAYPSTFRRPHTSTEMALDRGVEEYTKALGIPLLFGGYDRDYGGDYNSFFFLAPNGVLQVYHKSILLLFGEYIPGARSFKFLQEMFPQVGNFGVGPGPQVLSVQSRRFGPMICYEGLFPNYVIGMANRGAEILLNITNDSWFGPWGEPELHLALTTFRSIETRLPMVRATNTGISTVITATGEITHATPIGAQQILHTFVPVTDPIFTLVKLWGDWFGPFSLTLASLGLLLHFRPRFRQLVKKLTGSN